MDLRLVFARRLSQLANADASVSVLGNRRCYFIYNRKYSTKGPLLAAVRHLCLWFFLTLVTMRGLRLYWPVPIVAAAVIQACSGAARGFAASLYDRPNGMELAIFNDLCFC